MQLVTNKAKGTTSVQEQWKSTLTDGMQPPFMTTFCITVKSGYNYTKQTNLLKTQSTFYVNIDFEPHRGHCVILVEGQIG